MDGETQEYSDIRLLEAKPKENASEEEAAAMEDSMLLQPLSNAPFVTGGPWVGETSLSDGPLTWM
jgi:hypothetical protein